MTKFFVGLSILVVASMSSCGESTGTSSSNGCFGQIPGMIDSYKTKLNKIKSKENDKNYEAIYEQTEALTNEVSAEIEKVAIEMDGKELQCNVDEACLKINKPVKIKFKSMNKVWPWYEFDTEVVAAKDLVLKADPSKLKQSRVYDKVRMPVNLEYLDKEGNVVKTIESVGNFEAEDDGETAVIKAGTPIEFSYTIAVTEELLDAESIRFVVDLDKEPYII